MWCSVWIGPLRSPINERGGGRGFGRTSADAFLLGPIAGQVTQILVEWKFTEGVNRPLTLGRFCGTSGVERLRKGTRRRWPGCKRWCSFPFDFSKKYSEREGGARGLADLAPDYLYQLLRMTLLAKTTVGEALGPYRIEDYRMLHSTHSRNDEIELLRGRHLALSPGLAKCAGRSLHEVWREILAPGERESSMPGTGTRSSARLRMRSSVRTLWKGTAASRSLDLLPPLASRVPALAGA